MILTSSAGGCLSAAESVVLDDGTVQVVPEHPIKIHVAPFPDLRKQLRRSPGHGRVLVLPRRRVAGHLAALPSGHEGWCCLAPGVGADMARD